MQTSSCETALDCVDPVTTDRIRSNGSYIFSNLRFSLDYQRVLELLMGERLYGNPVLALRELLQNAFDAVRVRAAMESKGNELFKPEVTVTLEGNRLIVEDNGCGMDDEIVRKYFMQVGRSYYSSAEFRGENLQVEMTSEFGIGVLSAFMVADAMEVMSRRRSPDPLMPSVPIFLEIVAANQYFVQRPSSQRRIGTTVVLHLRKDHPFRQETLATLVASMLPFGEYPVRVRSVAGDEVIDPRRPERFRYGDFFGFQEVVRVELEGKHPELSGLKGLVRVAAGRGDYNPRYCSGVLAKNGFLVGSPSMEALSQKSVSIADRKEQFAALEQLLPGWLVVEAELDIRGQGELQLSPARTRFIENAALAAVRVALEDAISEGLRRTLLESMHRLGSEKYVEHLNHLLRGSMFGQLEGAPNLSSESIRLLQDCIAAPIAKEDGSISYRTPASWGSCDIFVIGSPDAASSDKRSELIRALEERSGGRGALVMLCGEGRDFSFDQVGRHKHVVVKRLRRGMRYLVTGVAGVVAQCFRDGDDVEANWNVNYYSYPGWHTQSLSGCIESQDGTIPMVVFDSMEGHFYFGKVVWNARHPVLAPVGRPADGREVIGEAMWRIEHGLLCEINRTLERDNLNGYWALGFELPTHAPATL